MGTRAIIGLQIKGMEPVTGIYSHCDGMLRHVGMGLLNHFNDIKSVKKLISKGNITSLYGDGEVVPWDEKSTGAPSVIYPTREDFIHKSYYCYYVYIYVYDEEKKSGHWEYKYLLDDKECKLPFNRLYKKDCKE